MIWNGENNPQYFYWYQFILLCLVNRCNVASSNNIQHKVKFVLPVYILTTHYTARIKCLLNSQRSYAIKIWLYWDSNLRSLEWVFEIPRLEPLHWTLSTNTCFKTVWHHLSFEIIFFENFVLFTCKSGSDDYIPARVLFNFLGHNFLVLKFACKCRFLLTATKGQKTLSMLHSK